MGYLERKKEEKEAKSIDFWVPIPSKTFIIQAGDISTINVRHVEQDLVSSEASRILESPVKITLDGEIEL